MFKRDAMMQVALLVGPIVLGLVVALLAPLLLSLYRSRYSRISFWESAQQRSRAAVRRPKR